MLSRFKEHLQSLVFTINVSTDKPHIELTFEEPNFWQNSAEYSC